MNRFEFEGYAIETRLLSSLVKVFPDEAPQDPELTQATALRDERYSFQLAFCAVEGNRFPRFACEVESPLAKYVQVRLVENVPSEMPCRSDRDDYVLRDTPGLYPDILSDFPVKTGLRPRAGIWTSLWITVDTRGKAKPGRYPITVVLHNVDGSVQPSAEKEVLRETFMLEILDAYLSDKAPIVTRWFHCDCISEYHKTPVFSRRFNTLMTRYIRMAADYGCNMILTPLFTPPLDTAVGGERLTVQLIRVEKTADGYCFGFEKLKWFVDVCLKNGIEYFEISHLFTQWGAAHAPKIIATVDGKEQQIFGWDTDSHGPEYESFLGQLLDELMVFIHENGLEHRVYFHVSDEPNAGNAESYAKAAALVRAHVGDMPIIDALSDYLFYEKGYVKTPIPANNHVMPFIAHNVPNLWTYYCCGQYQNNVSNAFFNMPSARTRVLGVQMYKYNIVGFLHWGYNFYHSALSLRNIDPYRVTDADGAFPSGDAYVVYPGEDGPIPSLRLAVFYEGLQDMRALAALEERVGREKTMEILEADIDPITFEQYPHGAQWLLQLRERVNRALAEAAKA